MIAEPFQSIADQPVKRRGKGMGIFAVSLLILSSMGYAASQPAVQVPAMATRAQSAPAPSNPTATPQPARVRLLTGERLRVTGPFFGCSSVEDYRSVIVLIRADLKAAEDRFARLSRDGKCRSFRVGDELVVEKNDFDRIESSVCVVMGGSGAACVWIDRGVAMRFVEAR